MWMTRVFILDVLGGRMSWNSMSLRLFFTYKHKEGVSWCCPVSGTDLGRVPKMSSVSQNGGCRERKQRTCEVPPKS